MFFSCIGFSIIVPSLAPFLARMRASENFLGVVVAIYSFGEMLGSLYFGKAFEVGEARCEHAAVRRTLERTIEWGVAGARPR